MPSLSTRLCLVLAVAVLPLAAVLLEDTGLVRNRHGAVQIGSTAEEEAGESLGEDTGPRRKQRAWRQFKAERANLGEEGEEPTTLSALEAAFIAGYDHASNDRCSATTFNTTTWKGSFNRTHATEVPRQAQDGKLEARTTPSGGRLKGKSGERKAIERKALARCKTQIAVIRGMGNWWTQKGKKGSAVPQFSEVEARSSAQCTSCKPEYYFLMRTHKPMAGSCVPFQKKPRVHCVALGSNTADYDWVGDDDGVPVDQICTKAAVLETRLSLAKLPEKSTMRKHLAPIIKTKGRTAWEEYRSIVLARCNAWKQVVCHGKTCDVKKRVECTEVCSTVSSQNFNKHSAAPGIDLFQPIEKSCSAKYCEGPFYANGTQVMSKSYGALLCRQAAMVF